MACLQTKVTKPQDKNMAEKNQDDKDDEFHWRWYLDDPHKPVDLSDDRLSVIFHPRKSSGCTGLRGDKPFLQNMEHWFYVKMFSPFHGQARMVGIGLKTTKLNSNAKNFYPLIGKSSSSWGLNYDGKTHHDGDFKDYTDVNVHQKNRESITVGVYYNSYYGHLVFSIDDESLGLAYDNIPTILELYPMICATSYRSKMELVHCGSCVTSLKSLCRGTIRMYLKKEDNVKDLPIPPHLKAYLNFKHYEHPKDYHSILNLKSAADDS